MEAQRGQAIWHKRGVGWGSLEEHFVEEVINIVGLGMKGMSSHGKCHRKIGEIVWGSWSRIPREWEKSNEDEESSLTFTGISNLSWGVKTERMKDLFEIILMPVVWKVVGRSQARFRDFPIIVTR